MMVKQSSVKVDKEIVIHSVVGLWIGKKFSHVLFLINIACSIMHFNTLKGHIKFSQIQDFNGLEVLIHALVCINDTSTL